MYVKNHGRIVEYSRKSKSDSRARAAIAYPQNG